MPRLVDAHEAGAVLGVHAETVRRLSREGRIPAYRVGRYLRFDPTELLAATHVEAAHPIVRSASHDAGPVAS